jgi:hypothetical protein
MLTLACNSNINTNYSNQETEGDSQTNQSIKITPFYATFLYYENKSISDFNAIMDIKNQSASRITDLSIKGFLEIQFKNESMMYIPTPYNFFDDDEKPESEYADGILPIEPKIIGDRIGVDNPLTQNKSIRVEFTIPGDGDNSVKYDLKKEYFQRTPERVVFVIKYKAISVDGEYEELVRFDIMDLWKDFQTRIGLR